jgi:hypothetical protein
MLYVLGHPLRISVDAICNRSGDDHGKLVAEARAARVAGGFNVEESYVLCLRCGQGLSLKA